MAVASTCARPGTGGPSAEPATAAGMDATLLDFMSHLLPVSSAQ